MINTSIYVKISKVMKMKYIYQIQKNKIIPQEKILKNYWIHLNDPTDEEIKLISKELKIDEKDIKKPLDRSEVPHIAIENKTIIYIISIPYVIESPEKKKYRVLPFGIFQSEKGILTISKTNHPILKDIKQEKILNLKYDNSFPIYLIGKSVEYYLKYLNEIQEDILKKEKTLIKSTSNKDLEQMLTLQKSLLFFTTALQGNETILEKIENNGTLKEEDLELLKDTQIEIKQGIEMAKTYREILENTMDTYSSIISNNLNDIMKFLTSITLVISIPTMISSFLGMNVFLGDFGTNPYSFILIILLAFFISLVLVILLKKKNLL